MFKHVIALVVLFAIASIPKTASAQITVPNTLAAGAVIRASELNTNFSTLGDKSLNRITGGTVEGNVTLSTDVTFDGVDISDYLLSTGEVRGGTAGTVSAPTFSISSDTNTGLYFPAADQVAFTLGGTQRMLLNTNGLTVFGVNIVNSSGKIPALSSTYLASLDGSALTALNASNVSSGTLGDGRLSSNVPLKDGTNTFTGAQTFTLNGTALTVTPGSAPAADTKLLNIQNAVPTTVFSVDYEGDTALNSVTISSSTGFKMGTSTTAGFVLTADASGNGSWQDPSAASGNVPSGAILLFDTSCPVTYTRVSDWDNKFLRGGATYVLAGGGSDTHTHTVDPPNYETTSAGAHTHTVDPLSTATTTDGSHTHTTDSQGSHSHTPASASDFTSFDGSHSHTGTTDNGGTHSHATINVDANNDGLVEGVYDSAGGDHNHTFTTSTASTHRHSISFPNTSSGGAHTHTAAADLGHSHSVDIAITTTSITANHEHNLNIPEQTTASGANVPSYTQVVFCKKD